MKRSSDQSRPANADFIYFTRSGEVPVIAKRQGAAYEKKHGPSGPDHPPLSGYHRKRPMNPTYRS